MESLQILKYTQRQDISGRTPIQSTELKLKSKWHLLKLKDIDTDAVSGCIIYALLAAQNGPAKSISGCSRDTQVRKWRGQFTCPRVLAYIQTAERETLSDAERRRLRHPESDTHWHWTPDGHMTACLLALHHQDCVYLMGGSLFISYYDITCLQTSQCVSDYRDITIAATWEYLQICL